LSSICHILYGGLVTLQCKLSPCHATFALLSSSQSYFPSPAAHLPPPVSAGPLAAQLAEVFFSPGGGVTEAVASELGNAKKDIVVQAYSFTSAPIAKALVDAHKRGVKVTVVLDRSQRSTKYSSADFVNNAGIPIYIDAKHPVACGKITG
jgi:phosphatidylserine/phosphatidylglycerophosphate/cardiolipin synthase-like enzyme